MTDKEFYREKYYILQSGLEQLLGKIALIRNYRKSLGMSDPVEHSKGRIKSADSMLEKLGRKGLEPTVTNAISQIHDAIGVRVVCSFIKDVYDMAELIKSMQDVEIINEKDYILNPKSNGYRSYHMIVMLNIALPGGIVRIPAEIQLRTIAQDSWAALEHQLKYKKDIRDVKLIQSELKRCADETASTELTMQTVRDMIMNNN